VEVKPILREDAEPLLQAAVPFIAAPILGHAGEGPSTAGVLAGPTIASPELLRSAQGCADPVLGTWVSTTYLPTHRGWYEFTLHVRADGEEGLHGEILSHFWRSAATSPQPPSYCDPALGEEWTVHMPATGRRVNGSFEFGGTSWSVQQRTCGRVPSPGMYNLDQFSGSLPAGGDALKTVNNDGGVLRDYPTNFVRVSCGN